MKTCSRCKTEKEYAEFNRDRSRHDGYHYYCKACILAYKRTDHYRKLKSGWDKEYRDKKGQILLDKKREYYEKNKEVMKAKFRANYRKKHLDYKERARQRKNRLKSTVREPYTKLGIYERDKGICFRCREWVDANLLHPDPKSLSIHHMLPLILGGHDTPDNVVTSHLECNLKQGTRIFDISRAHL